MYHAAPPLSISINIENMAPYFVDFLQFPRKNLLPDVNESALPAPPVYPPDPMPYFYFISPQTMNRRHSLYSTVFSIKISLILWISFIAIDIKKRRVKDTPESLAVFAKRLFSCNIVLIFTPFTASCGKRVFPAYPSLPVARISTLTVSVSKPAYPAYTSLTK